MHGKLERAAGEKVDARLLELPGAGTRQDEADVPVLLHQRVDHVEYGGDALDFVHHERLGPRVRVDELAEPFRMRLERPECDGFEKVEEHGVGQRLLEPGRLARSARAEQEEMVIRSGEKSANGFHEVGILP